jgi:NAD(P)-dependent dehydrogenase (short-subunit alcohol dehydrogenase family)
MTLPTHVSAGQVSVQSGIQLFRMDGQSAVVTGGSKGLGLAMAAGLASAGAKLALVSRTAEECKSAAAALASQFGVQAVGIQADVTQEQDCERVARECSDTIGEPSILINSAGINIRGPIETLTLEQFEQVQSTNVRGPWLMTRAVLPAMKRCGYGRILHIASTLGLVGLANRTPYATSKGAVVQMTRAMALELAPWGITCNAICPGPFLTEMNQPIASSEEAKTHIVGATALGRWGELHEIQGAAIYLSSPASSYVIGSMLVVDGGWTAR